MKPDAPDSRDPSPAEADAAAPCADDGEGWLSALSDGQVEALAPACRLWRDDARSRQTWHAYHLIGDVLRSDELASPPSRDAAFLAGVRARLAAEPVLLVPLIAPRRRQRWMLPAAAVAGFAVVAGVLVVSRSGLPEVPAAGDSFAIASSPAGNGIRLVGNSVRRASQLLASDQAVGRDERYIRDVRLDEYLRAHQAARGAAAAAAPGDPLRRVEAIVPAGSER
jgi:sigma-E factor negative regulatory protein RseA